MRTFSIALLLVFSLVAAAVALYWFFQATALPVADLGQQTLQVLYNIHAALWSLIAVVSFGLAALLMRPVSAARHAASEAPLPEPAARPAASGRAGRERVEPRL